MFEISHLNGFGAFSAPIITQALSSTSTASTIAVPSGVRAGDLMVLLDSSYNAGSAASTVIPSGFTSLSNLTLTSFRQIVSYKKADGTEGGGNLTGVNASDDNNKALYVFRLSNPASSVTPSTPNGQAVGGDPTAQVVSASSGVAPLVVLGAYGAQIAGVISPRTFTVGGIDAKDGEINPSSSAYLAYKIFNSLPQDVTVDMEDEVGNILQSFYIQMAQ